MKILFWNVQRWGGTTARARAEMREELVTSFLADSDYDDLRHVVFCEITSGGVALYPMVRQATAVGRGSGRAHQLGYVAFRPAAFPATATVDLVPEEIPPFAEVWGQASGKAVDLPFNAVARRSVSRLAAEGRRNLYVFHANASDRAPLLVAWAAKHLHDKHDGDFVLFGDLNCTPQDLSVQLSLLESRSRSAPRARTAAAATPPATDERIMERSPAVLTPRFRLCSGGPTFNAKGSLSRVLDWAVTGSRHHVDVSVIHPEYVRILSEGVVESLEDRGELAPGTADGTRLISDHLPIIVELT